MSNYMQALRQEIGQVYNTRTNTVSRASDSWTNDDCYETEDTIDSIDECQFWSNDDEDIDDIDECQVFNV